MQENMMGQVIDCPSNILPSVRLSKEWLIHWGYTVKLQLDGNKNVDNNTPCLQQPEITTYCNLLHGQFNCFR